MTTRQIYDFGPVKVVQPAEPISQSQWASIRAALSLTAHGLTSAGAAVLDLAGVMTWPPRKLRTTSAWTEPQKAFALAHHNELDAYQLARSISSLGPERSATAVEKFLNQRGFKVRWIRGRMSGSGQRVDPNGWAVQDDRAHVVAVLKARRSGFDWDRAA
jgi:hypothetical protein